MRTLGDRYVLEKRIAAGGMGEVWRAHDGLLRRTVAVKLLRPEYSDSREFRERLSQEGRNAAQLAHPGVAQVYDFDDGSAQGMPYLVMEYVRGRPLSDVLAEEGTLSPERVAFLVARTADALDCAHAAGVVHRDVKPGNLLVEGGQLKITDFGIARAAGTVPLTRTGMVMGTPLYMSPEQAVGSPATPASDIYALGIIAYECLVGRPPFEGDGFAVAVAHRDRPLPELPASVPTPVVELVAALTAKDPAARPASAKAVAEWADRVRDDPQVAGVPAGPVAEAVPLAELPPITAVKPGAPARRRTVQGLAALAVGAVGVWGFWVMQPSHDAVSAAAPATAETAQRTVMLDPSAYYGVPAVEVVQRLRDMGLRPQVREVSEPSGPTGVVAGITPSGDVAVGSQVTVFVTKVRNSARSGVGSPLAAHPAPSRSSGAPSPSAKPSSPAPPPAFRHPPGGGDGGGHDHRNGGGGGN